MPVSAVGTGNLSTVVVSSTLSAVGNLNLCYHSTLQWAGVQLAVVSRVGTVLSLTTLQPSITAVFGGGCTSSGMAIIQSVCFEGERESTDYKALMSIGSEA